MTRPLDLRWQDGVNQQVGVTVDQPGKERRGAQVNDPCARRYMSLHLRGRSYFLDLVAFNQHRRGRKDIPGPRIEQATSFYQSCRRRRLSGQLCNCKNSDCERKDSIYGHMFVSDEMRQNHYCSRARKKFEKSYRQSRDKFLLDSRNKFLSQGSHFGMTASCPATPSSKN